MMWNSNISLYEILRIVDSILPVGRGQRQSISGDRYTGKTPIYLPQFIIPILYQLMSLLLIIIILLSFIYYHLLFFNFLFIYGSMFSKTIIQSNSSCKYNG